jgi:hypothetical protein
MPRFDRDLPVVSWRHIVWENCLGPALSIVAVWLWYLSTVIFRFDVVAWLTRRDQMERPDDLITFAFCSAIFVTCVGGAMMSRRLRLAWLLTERGVEVVATVTKVGTFVAYQQTRVYYQYSCDGQVVDKIMSCILDEANAYEAGTKQLILICDPINPRRSMEKSAVYPKGD